MATQFRKVLLMPSTRPTVGNLSPKEIKSLAQANLAKMRLGDYASLMFPPYDTAPHAKLIVEALEAVERGDILRLMIAMPPRHGKSLHTSILFKSWCRRRSASRRSDSCAWVDLLAGPLGRKSTIILGARFRAEPSFCSEKGFQFMELLLDATSNQF